MEVAENITKNLIETATEFLHKTGSSSDTVKLEAALAAFDSEDLESMCDLECANYEGMKTEVEELIRVALTNKDGLDEFIKMNWLEEYEKHRSWR